jgi:predicted O-methyltransferase YrrM
MTTRETTSFLTRRGGADISRTSLDWARLLGFGAVQWPWLLKSLYGGRLQDKQALLRRLHLPNDALPHLGSWKADVGLLSLIADVIAKTRPAVMVELGSGASTLIAGRAIQMAGHDGRLVSFDQHSDFVAATSAWLARHGVKAEMRCAPMVSPSGEWADLWYDLRGVPASIDLLVIDGPPWTVDPQVRGKAECLFDRMVPGGIVILDDASRPGERLVAQYWRQNWPMVQWEYISGIKGTLIGHWPKV